MTTGKKALVSLFCAFALACGIAAKDTSSDTPADTRAQARKEEKSGNFKTAYTLYEKLALDSKTNGNDAGADLRQGTYCLQRLNRLNEFDMFIEKVIKVHEKDWRLLQAAAQQYVDVQHYGYIVAGEFNRGPHRGGGQYANAFDRDRMRALQLMDQGLKAARNDKDQAAVADFYIRFSNMLLRGRGNSEAWRLQYLTDLSKLPDHEEGGWNRWGWGGSSTGAPVDENGEPVYHHLPKSYEDAKTDGERWRWMLIQAMELAPGRTAEILSNYASFLRTQFGCQTMSAYPQYLRARTDDDRKDTSGTYELHTLEEQETIARLACGVKRFSLPDEFNFIKLYQRIAKEQKGHHAETALNVLAEIFENRRQYAKAADYWGQTIQQYGAGHNQWKQKRLDQIVKNWGSFESIMTQPAGQGATVEFKFRNGNKVHFEARRIDTKQLLSDIKAYLKSNPNQLDWQKMNIANIGYSMVQGKGDTYIKEKVAEWDLALKPRPMHFDRRVTVTTPLQEAGAYWLTSRMEDGNTGHIIIWLDDTVIIKKALDKGVYHFIADATTGKPIPKANVEFFGYRQEYLQKNAQPGRRFNILIENFAEYSDMQGQVILKEGKIPSNYNWLITATTEAGRFAYLGFSGIWFGRHHDSEYNQVKVFTMTDRPVYRPNQEVKFKTWIRHAKYDKEDESSFANQSFKIQITNPKGEKVLEKHLKTDDYGGLEGTFLLPKDATLGQYYVQIPSQQVQAQRVSGGGHFRVEEYKKPEFEVTVDAPTEPVMLGEKITATVTAKYYFGSPVTKAQVKYKVLRTSYSADWYPTAPWDWFYGHGYWWFAYDYAWYPGWNEWGCKRPHCWWWPVRHEQPEVVAEADVNLGEDGTAKIVIDTGIAKEIHGDTDHKYSITAEVRDESRRTIVGTGQVLVARKPFKVYAWVDRGYYRVGDVVRADFHAQTLDNKPVEGRGVLNLYKISYKDNKPVETSVREWPLLNTDEEGKARIQIKASEAGQYRLSYKVRDVKKHVMEGGYVFAVMGIGNDAKDFKFNELEIVPDKREYSPGDKVKLVVNTDRKGGTVLFFARPSNGIYLPPKVVELQGKSFSEELDVTKKDMPNFFVEAVTIYNGKVYTETREIVVPPEKRVVNVEVTPSKNSYKPGEKAKVKVKLTDFFGKPFVGSLVMTIYDKSVEYISGGSNVGDIKGFFWKWRRHHRPHTESTLSRFFSNLVKPHVESMRNLGAFGHLVAQEMEGLDGANQDKANFGAIGGGRGGVVAKAAAAPGAPMMARAASADAMAAPAEYAMLKMEKKSNNRRALQDREGGAPAATVEPTVRTQFADTALWAGSLTTDKDGMAEVDLTMPENLTGWKVRTWALGHGTKVGEGSAEVVTAKKLMLRLQAPRFFVEKDEVVLSANIHNYLAKEKKVQDVLELDGKALALADKGTQEITVKANGEQRVNWRVKVLQEGEAVIRMKALTDEESDAMQMTFPVYVHGMMKVESFSGAIRPENTSASITINVPKERRIDQSRMEIRYSPTLAGAMVDALPYLVSYPYGCTEQTLSRFLPSVITQKILMNMGLDLKTIQEKRTNLNAQEIGDDKKRAEQWKRWDHNPVFDKEEMEDMVKAGVKHITAMQLSDGGWGWFSGWGERSYPHTTAYVVHGLQVALENDVAIVPGVLDRGMQWLKNYQAQQIQMLQNAPSQTHPYKTCADNLDAFVYMVLVDAKSHNETMRDFLYRDRTKLSVYGLSMFGLALHKVDNKDKLAMVQENIEQYLVQDNENQTAWLNLPNTSYWWYWYGSEMEAHAYYLKLLAKVEPKSTKASRLVKYLLNNRKNATYWNSTRDTALCVEAMADYIKGSGEDKPDMTVEIYIDKRKHKEVKINANNLFSFDNKCVLIGDAVESGKHTIEVRKKGTGPLYFNAYVNNFTLEDFITKAGLEIKVERQYYKLTRVDKSVKAQGARGQAVDQKVEKYERALLKNLDTLRSGDLVEIELIIESKNDYEYIVFEDMKAAGFEPVDVQSGYNRNSLGAYMELRDERVCFFVRWLARGRHSVSYRMRAEIPGKFSALPTKAYAMYAPELKANSDEIKLKIKD